MPGRCSLAYDRDLHSGAPQVDIGLLLRCQRLLLRQVFPVAFGQLSQVMLVVLARFNVHRVKVDFPQSLERLFLVVEDAEQVQSAMDALDDLDAEQAS